MSRTSGMDMECRIYRNFSSLPDFEADSKTEQDLLCPEQPDTVSAVQDKLAPFRNRHGKIRGHLHEKNQVICDWIEGILATPDFAGGHKLIQTAKGKKAEYGFKTLAFLPQQHTEEGRRSREYWIKSVWFNPKRLYYITKNSYKGNRAGTANLFSLDNIVIDIDNHHTTAKYLDFDVNKLIYILDNDYEGVLPHFGIVYTGRGIQLWIGMESVYASEKLIYRYEQLSRIFCDILQKIIDENEIRLEVDYAASVRASGLVKVPETWNPKRRSKDKKIRQERFPIQKYSMPELFREYTDIVLPYDEDTEFRPVNKADIVMPENRQEKKSGRRISGKHDGTKDFSAYQLKKIMFLEKLAKANNGEMTGRREMVLFHYYNAACQVFEKEEAVRMVKELNRQFTEPLHNNAVRTTIKGIDNHVVTEEQNQGFTEEGAYTRYNTVTFLRDVCINEEEQRMYYGCTQGRERIREEKRRQKKERHEQIAELYSRGMTQQEIADTLHIAVSTVNRNLMKISASRQEKTETEQRNQEIISLKQQGMTQKQIAEALHICIPTVRKVLKQHDMNQNELRNQKILKLHKEGNSQRTIAEMLGISRNTVSSVLKKQHDEEQTAKVQEEPIADTQQPETTVRETAPEETEKQHTVYTVMMLPFHYRKVKNIMTYNQQYLEPLCRLPAMRFKRGSPETKAGIYQTISPVNKKTNRAGGSKQKLIFHFRT